jgi:uncharacterized protein YjgD (DUF1641 family)
MESVSSTLSGIAPQDSPSTPPTSTVIANEKDAVESVLDVASSLNSNGALNAAQNVLNSASTPKNSNALNAAQSALNMVSNPNDNNVLDAAKSALGAASDGKKAKKFGLRALRASLTDASITERINKLTNTDT